MGSGGRSRYLASMSALLNTQKELARQFHEAVCSIDLLTAANARCEHAPSRWNSAQIAAFQAFALQDFACKASHPPTCWGLAPAPSARFIQPPGVGPATVGCSKRRPKPPPGRASGWIFTRYTQLFIMPRRFQVNCSSSKIPGDKEEA